MLMPGVEIDSTCRIQFTFTSKGVTVIEQTADFNFGCGFGHAVVADGFFKKVSGEQPEFTDHLNKRSIIDLGQPVQVFLLHYVP